MTITEIKATGPVLKKDGSDSVNRAKETPWGNDVPEWVAQIIKGLA